MKKVHVLLLLATFALLGLLAATRISDPDTMQYLASGRAMLARGLDYGCVFNYSSDQCQVVYPQWLFHIATYGVYLLGGWNALVAFQIAIVLVVFTVIGMHHWRRKRHPLVICALLLLVALVARERFMLRADLFALLPAVLLYYTLDRYWDPATPATQRRWLLAALAGIQILWANTHGSFPLALLLLGAFVAPSALNLLLQRLKAPRAPTPPRLMDKSRQGSRAAAGCGMREMLLACAAILAASFVNPFGLKSSLQPFRFLLGGEGTAPQLEFVSPFVPADLVHLTVWAYKLLLLVVLGLLLASFRSVTARDVLILAPLLYLSATGVRHLALFAVFCAILLPPYAERLRERLAGWLERRGNAQRARASAVGVSALLAASIGTIGYFAATDRIYRFDALSRRTGFGLSDVVYPSAAADFVEQNDLTGNIFNDYGSGTYLNWRLHPRRKTFIDGHSYTPELLAYYFLVMAGNVRYQDTVEKYKINVFFLGHTGAESRALMARLYRDPDWVPVYFDEMAMIFVKRAPGNERVIARFRVDVAAGLNFRSRALANMRSSKDFDLGHTNRGLALSVLGFDAQAVIELEEAVRENPRSFVALTALGLLLQKQGENARALEACQRAAALRAGYAPGHFWLGMVLLQQGRTREGIDELERTLRTNRRFPLAHYNLGAALERSGDKSGAREHYQRELELDPHSQPARRALRRLG